MIYRMAGGVHESTPRVEDFHEGDVVAVVHNGGRSFFYARVLGPATAASSGPGGRMRVLRSDLFGIAVAGAVPKNRAARNLVLKARDGKAV
jgi:hypothetical protein